MLWGEAAIPHHRSCKGREVELQIPTAAAANRSRPSCNGASGELQRCAAGASIVRRGSCLPELQAANVAVVSTASGLQAHRGAPPRCCKPAVECCRCVADLPTLAPHPCCRPAAGRRRR